MDPAKLKVVELRAELAARGLDQKGVKAILVSRLQAALDQEKQNLTAAVSTDVDLSVQQQDPSIIENQFLPEQQFQVQTEPSLQLPVFPDTSPNFVETFSTNESEYEAPDQYEAPIPEQQQQQQQDYYQEEAEAQFFNQNQIQQQQQLQQVQQQQQQQKQYEDDDDEEEESESSQSENESNAEENNFDQNDDVSCEPVEQPQQQQQFVDTDEPMESEQTDGLNEFANQNISESNENHELNEATEYEKNPQTKLSESNEPMATENPDDDDDDEKLSTKNGNEKDESETRKSPSRDKDKESSIPDKESEKQENRKRKRSRSKSKSPPAKRANRRASPARNTDDFTNEEDEPEFDENAVLLSWYDSDLNLAINKSDLCSARPLSDGALALAWAGARSTYGVNKGKVCYEVQVNEINRIQNLSEERNLYELRCGWSILSDNLQLGESNLSFGYSGCAKKATDSVFNEYGIKYGSRGDVVGVYLDLDSTPCTIQYTVNGEPQGTAFEFNKEDLNGASLYPHILTKNLAFTVNFGQCPKLLVNEERPNRARRDESSRRDKDKDKRSKDSRKSSSPASDDKKKSTAKSESQKSNEKNKEKEATESTDIDAELKGQPEENAGEQDEDKEKVATSENGDSNDDAKNGEKDKPNELQQKEYSLLPGYQLIGTIGIDDLEQGYQRPKTRNECEVILLIGLPGAGKTHWANQHSKDNVEKHYNILGVQNLLSKMTVCGESRKKHHSHGRWERFIDWATRGLHSIQDIAVKKRRNYILDQTNVLASAQRRKMKGYGDFKRIAAVIIPDDATHKERYDKVTEKIVSENSLNEMKANFTLPSTDFGWFDEVLYTELDEEESKKKVQEFNEKGKKAVKERERDSDRGDRRRDDNRDRYGRDRRNWGQSSSDRRWRHQQGSSSQWHNRGIGGGGGSSGGAGGRNRDKWHGSSSSSSSSWGNRRYDYPNHRDRRHDDRRGGNRSDRDYKDNRDKRGGGGDKHGSKREKDNHSSSRSSYSSKGSSSHWNSNKSYNRSQTMSSNSRDYGSYSSMSSGSSNWASATSSYTPQQQQWLQWQQQGPLMQASQQHQSQQQHQQANNAQWWPQQQQQQASGNHQGWQNWAQYAQAYGVNASNSNGANMGKK